MNLSLLSSTELEAEFTSVVKSERKIMHEVLLFIQEIHRRSHHKIMGYDDLAKYLVEKHHYSEGPARQRIRAMEMLSTLPELKDKIIEGELTLTQLAMAQSAISHKQNTENMTVSKEETIELLLKMENQTIEETKSVIAETLQVDSREKTDHVW